MKTRNKNLTLALACVLIGILIGSYIGYASSPSATMTISSGQYPAAPSYTIYALGGTYYAKDQNGYNEFSGTDAATMFQAVFDTDPKSVFFKAGTYNLNNQELSCASPVILRGEGNSKTIFEDGTLIITGGAWEDTGSVVQDLDFKVTGGQVALHLVKVLNGYVNRVKFHKTSYAPSVPSLWITSCASLRVEDNWFDYYQMQIIKMDGNESAADLSVNIIERNDFGSTSAAFPSYTNYWDVAAIYIADATQKGTFIKDNIGYLNNENCFVYSVAPQTWVVGNNIAAGEGKYAIDLFGDNNVVQDNFVGAAVGSLGVIRFRDTDNERNRIENNELDMGANVVGLSGVLYRSVISGNVIFFSETALNLTDCNYNTIANNYFGLSVAGSGFAILEAGTAYYNLIEGNYFDSSVTISKTVNSQSAYRNNYGSWLTENSGTATNSTATTFSITHGLAGTPTGVWASFNTAQITAWTWTATSSTITITVTGSGLPASITAYWKAEYKP